jgi:SAM-dependent methyltransferase
MATSPRVVLVREQQAALSHGLEPVFTLNYRFIDDHPQDGFAAWVNAESENSQDIDVAAHCRRFDGGFKQQALNRHMAQAVIRERPRALVIQGLWGCTADLSRIAALLGVPSVICLSPGQRWPEPENESTRLWLASCRTHCAYVLVDDADSDVDSRGRDNGDDNGDGDHNVNGYDDSQPVASELAQLLSTLPDPWLSPQAFSYASYEFALRDPPLLSAMQAGDVRHFEGQDTILDVACGAGIFMEALSAKGHTVTGVERDPEVVAYARGMGLKVIEEDALDYLRTATETYDGIHCSHFIEHVPIEVAQELLALLYQRTRPGGAVVLTFPDPESIRSQLLGFWRDPEHVRFYHPDLVCAMATVAGFRVEWTSHQQQPHRLVPFAEHPPQLPALSVPPLPPAQALDPQVGEQAGQQRQGLRDRMLAAIGLQSRRRSEAESAQWKLWAEAMQASLREQQSALETLAQGTKTLWAVNQTWAWQDNATIRLRRRDN